MDFIREFRGEYRFLSNFYLSPVEGYTTVEAYFQSRKSFDAAYRERLLSMGPREAKQAGRKVVLHPDWEQVKNNVMFEALQMKFPEGSELATRLIDTGDLGLVEGNTWHDTYWGRCFCASHNGSGANHLGRLLMAVRFELRYRE